MLGRGEARHFHPHLCHNRRSDSIDKAGQIHRWLVERFPEGRISLDVDLIPGGADFRGVIERYITWSTVVLAIIGPTRLTAADPTGRRRLDAPDDFVRLELPPRSSMVFPLCPCSFRPRMPTEAELPPIAPPAPCSARLRSRPTRHLRVSGRRSLLRVVSHTVSWL
jgi:hypothetical protein